MRELKRVRKAVGMMKQQVMEQVENKCVHEYLPADRISPFAIWCIKCGHTLIKNPYDGSVQEFYLPSGYLK